MRLSELKSGNTRHRPVENFAGQQIEIGTIRNAVAYPTPIEALYQGQPVTLLATGDIVGMSPAVQIVDEHGQLDWVSNEDVTVTDKLALPQDESKRQRLQRGQRSQQSSQQQ